MNALLQRNGLVRAHRLEGDEFGAGVHDEHARAIDGELLHAADRHLVDAAHARPFRHRRLRRLRRLAARVHLDLVRALQARLVAQALDGIAADDVRGEDLLQIGLAHARIPDVLGINDDHGSVAALREAPRLVDPHGALKIRLLHAGAKSLHVLLGVGLQGAGLAARTHEHVTVVLAHASLLGRAQLNLS